MLANRLTTLLMLSALTGCDQIGTLLELPDPVKDAARIEAEGKAVGAACRYAGRALEDCYVLNSSAPKAAIFMGWKDMNDYMMENKIEVVPSSLGSNATGAPPVMQEAAAAHPAAGEPSPPPEGVQEPRKSKRNAR